MSEKEQITRLAKDLEAIIHRYKLEYNMTVGAVIGTIEVVKLELFMEQLNMNNEE